jgi:uncharacterized protein YndB with AHSA1/START domain
MRFMLLMIPRGYEDAAPGTVPDDVAAVEAMMKYNEELQKAGVLLALDGLHPPSMGARVSFAGGTPVVTDGPFAESKEVLGGYWVIQVESREEAIAWARRCPGGENEIIEVRQVQELADFPADVQAVASKLPGMQTQATEREVVVARAVDAPRRLVFEAWTKPEHLPHWMLGPGGWTMPVCEIDLRPGGAWHFVWRRSDGSEMEMRGVYREVAPPERLVSTESWGGDWPETLNTLILAEQDGKTTITQRILYPSQPARDAALQTGMKRGMSQSFDRLDHYLRTLSR